MDTKSLKENAAYVKSETDEWNKAMDPSNFKNDVFCLKPLNPALVAQCFILNSEITKEFNIFKVGKSAGVANFTIDHEAVAPVHAILTPCYNAWNIFKDQLLTSPHFVTINKKPLTQHFLKVGDEICLGKKESRVFRFRFEKYEGQDERKYDLGCPNRECHSRQGREFLCEDCAYKEMGKFNQLCNDGVMEEGSFYLRPIHHPSGKIPLNNVKQIFKFDSFVPCDFYSTSLTFLRGRKGYYASCLTHKLNSRCILVNSQYLEEFHILLKEGDHISLSLPEDTTGSANCFEYGSEHEPASSYKSKNTSFHQDLINVLRRTWRGNFSLC